MDALKLLADELERRNTLLEKSIEAKKLEPTHTTENPMSREYIIEKKIAGARALIHKKGNIVKIFSDKRKDITSNFPIIAKQAREMSTKDFIVDCSIVPYDNDGKPLGKDIVLKYIGKEKEKSKFDDSNVLFFMFDCLYFDNRCVMDQDEYERKKILIEQVGSAMNIRKVRPYVVSSAGEARSVIKSLSCVCESSLSDGVMIKNPRAPYTVNSDSTAWIRYGTEFNETKILNSELELSKGDSEEGKEQEVQNFPATMQSNFKKVMDAKAWMPFMMHWHYRGHKITEKERETNNILPRYIYKLDSLHTDSRHLVPSSIALKEGEKFKWNDKRFNDNYIEGITLLSPTSTDKSIPDMISIGSDAKKGKIRAVIKKPESAWWAQFEGVPDVGEEGATSKAPATLVIVARGYYTVHDVTDHKIRIEYKTLSGNVNITPFNDADKNGILIERKPDTSLKNLNGMWQYQIAHIGNRYIILMKLLNKKETELYEVVDDFWDTKNRIRKDSPDKETIFRIIELSSQGTLRPSISRETGYSEDTIYKCQKAIHL